MCRPNSVQYLNCRVEMLYEVFLDLYKGKHDWQIEESEDRYYAQLSLDL